MRVTMRTWLAMFILAATLFGCVLAIVLVMLRSGLVALQAGGATWR